MKRVCHTMKSTDCSLWVLVLTTCVIQIESGGVNLQSPEVTFTVTQTFTASATSQSLSSLPDLDTSSDFSFTVTPTESFSLPDLTTEMPSTSTPIVTPTSTSTPVITPTSSSTSTPSPTPTPAPTTTLAPEPEEISEVSVQFSEPAPESGTTEFDDWVANLTAVLSQFYADEMGTSFKNLTIISVASNGTVYYEVVYESDDDGIGRFSRAHAALAFSPIKILGKLQALLSTTVDGKTYNIDNVDDPKNISCTIYISKTGGCQHGKICDVSNQRAYCKLIPTEDSTETVIGIVVGVLVFLCLSPIILCCAIVLHKRRRLVRLVKEKRTQEALTIRTEIWEKVQKDDYTTDDSSSVSESISETAQFTSLLPVLKSSIPVRFNTAGRVGERLYGSEFHDEWSNTGSLLVTRTSGSSTTSIARRSASRI